MLIFVPLTIYLQWIQPVLFIFSIAVILFLVKGVLTTDKGRAEDLLLLLTIFMIIPFCLSLFLSLNIEIGTLAIVSSLSATVAITLLFTEGRNFVLMRFLPKLEAYYNSEPMIAKNGYPHLSHLFIVLFRTPIKYRSLKQKEDAYKLHITFITGDYFACSGFKDKDDLINWMDKCSPIGKCVCCGKHSAEGSELNVVSVSHKVYQPNEVNVCQSCKYDLLNRIIKQNIYTEQELVLSQL